MNAKNSAFVLVVVAISLHVCLDVLGGSEVGPALIEDRVKKFVTALEEKINERDEKSLKEMVLPSIWSKMPRFPDDFEDRLRLEVVSISSETNLLVKVNSYLEKQPRNRQFVILGMLEEGDGLMLSSIMDPKLAQLNAEFERADIATRRLALAINRQDTNEVCRLTGIPDSIRQSGGRAVAAVLEKRKMSWICEAMRQRFRIQYSGVGRLADDDLRARLLEFGAGGVTNAKHVLQFKVDHFTHGENDLPLSP